MVPAPHKTRNLVLILLATLVVVVVGGSLIEAERTVNCACLFDPQLVWSLDRPEPGMLESRAVDNLTGRILDYSFYQFDRPAFVELALGDIENLETDTENSGVWCDEGHLIVSINSSSLDLELAERVTRVADARSLLVSLQGGAKPEELEAARIAIDRATADLRTLDLEYNRNRELADQGLISEADFELTVARHELAKIDLELSRAEYQVLDSGSRPEEIEAANVALTSLEKELETVRATASLQEIRSPVSGRLRLSHEEQKILTVSSCDTMVARILVPQRLAGLPRRGQRIRAFIPGLDTGFVEGEVIRVDHRSVATESGPYFTAVGRFANTRGSIREGMRGQARLYCGKAPLLGQFWRDAISALRQEIWPL